MELPDAELGLRHTASVNDFSTPQSPPVPPMRGHKLVSAEERRLRCSENAFVFLATIVAALVSGAVACAALAHPATQSLEDISNGLAQSLGMIFFGLLAGCAAAVAGGFVVRSRRRERSRHG